MQVFMRAFMQVLNRLIASAASFLCLLFCMQSLNTTAFAEEKLGPEPDQTSHVVEFHIIDGTKDGPWNERAAAVEVQVGQVLRIINDDHVDHYLHTPGAPCSHGSRPFHTGESYDCVVTSIADPDKTVLYDHNFGPDARFYVHATLAPGQRSVDDQQISHTRRSSMIRGIAKISAFFLSSAEASPQNASATAPLSGSTASTDIFAHGPATFKIENTAHKPPHFRVLSETASDKALALAIATALNAQPDVKPKLPVQDHIDLDLQTLTLTPETGGKLGLEVRVSGHDVDLPKSISRQDFLAGKPIRLAFDPSDKTISVFEVQFLGGHLFMNFDPASQNLVITDAAASMHYDMPLGDGDQSLKFSGRGYLKK
jgi:hypothetical protein